MNYQKSGQGTRQYKRTYGCYGADAGDFFIVVAGFDVLSTNAALVANQVEGNPLVREIQTLFGAWWLAPKVLFHLMLALLILWLPSRKMIAMARLVVVGYLAIFINNAYYAGWLT